LHAQHSGASHENRPKADSEASEPAVPEQESVGDDLEDHLLPIAKQRKPSRGVRPSLKSLPALPPWLSQIPKPSLRWTIGGVAALFVIVCFLPTILAYTSIVDGYLNGPLVNLNGTIKASSVSLGWFSPIVLSGVEVRDHDNQLVATVAKLSSEKSFLSLWRDSSRLGKFTFTKPKLAIVLRENGSNLEDVLKNYLASKDDKKSVDTEIEIVEGSVLIQDVRTKKEWQIDDFAFSIGIAADRKQPFKIATKGTLAESSGGGSFDLQMQLSREAGVKSPADAAQDPDQLKLVSVGIPLALAEPLVRRYVPGTRIDGQLTSTVEYHWDSWHKNSQATISGGIDCYNLVLRTPALGRDQPQVQKLRVRAKGMWQSGQVLLEQLKADSDFGVMAASGNFDFRNASTARKSANRMAAVMQNDFSLDGEVDLAKLAAILPDTLHIQKGSQITSGKATVSLSNKLDRQGAVCSGKLETSNLTATNAGQRYTWNQPITLAFAAHNTDQGPVVDKIDCKAEFLTVHAAPNNDGLTANLNFNLDKLVAQSKGFLDFRDTQLTGEGSSRLNWKRTGDNFELGAEFRIDRFQLLIPSRLTWTEPLVKGNLSATGQTNFSTTSRLNTAFLNVDAGDDRFQVRLMQPVQSIHRGDVLPLEVKSSGQFAKWQPRLSPWFNLKDWKLGGNYDLVSAVSLSNGRIGLQNARLTVENPLLEGPSLKIVDARAELTGSCNWDWSKRRFEVNKASLTSNSGRVDSDRFVCSTPEQGAMEIAGLVKAQLGLDKLQQWTNTTGAASPWRVQGTLDSQLEFRQTAGVATANFDATARNFQAVHSSGQRYDDPEIRLVGVGSYNDLNQSFQIEQAKFTSRTATCDVNGKVAQANGRATTQLNGNLNYDMARISELLRARFGQGIQLVGTGTSPISYRGSLGLDQSELSAGLGWKEGQIYGFWLGPAAVQATLAKGTLDVQPSKVWISEGQMQLHPQIRTSPVPMLTIDPGRVASNVRINPTMCNAAMQYAIPALAGVAQAEGKFSVDLESCQIPLSNPSQADITGKLQIHSVQLGPGYLTQELGTLLGRAAQAQLKKEAVVPFVVRQGRVYHDNLELVFSDITIRTKGSVGFDQSMAILIQMPLPTQWINTAKQAASTAKQGKDAATNAIAAAQSQSISVPLSGTLQHPKIDRAELDKLSRQFLQKTTETTIRNEASRQFDRLLKTPVKDVKK
jgi:hypothetical protein